MSYPKEHWLDGFGGYVADAMQAWRVPGLSIAVTDGERILYTEGFGWRDAGRRLAATSETVYAIGSCTKAFTAFGLGLLVDDGKLSWDTPVRDILPAFRLRDEVAGARATVRDLLCHRTGLPRHDTAWYQSPASRAELMLRAAHLEPTQDFRARYQYQNIMYIVAGLAIEALSGQSWERFTRERILDPLDMHCTYLDTSLARAQAELALPYQELRGTVREIPFYAQGHAPLGPAGHIQSNALDMAHWLMMHLNNGEHTGRRLLAEDTLRQILTPQVAAMDPKSLQYGFEEFGWLTYGLGWRLHGYRGRWIAQHSGAIDGFGAHASFMPAAGLGIVVLANLDGTDLPAAVAYNLYDRLLGLEPLPWAERFRGKVVAAQEGERAELRARAERRIDGTQPSHPLTAFIGNYLNRGYGPLHVSELDGGLRMSLNGRIWSLAHHHFDVFEATTELSEVTRLVTFSGDETGEVTNVSVRWEPTSSDIVFVRSTD